MVSYLPMLTNRLLKLWPVNLVSKPRLCCSSCTIIKLTRIFWAVVRLAVAMCRERGNSLLSTKKLLSEDPPITHQEARWTENSIFGRPINGTKHRILVDRIIFTEIRRFLIRFWQKVCLRNPQVFLQAAGQVSPDSPRALTWDWCLPDEVFFLTLVAACWVWCFLRRCTSLSKLRVDKSELFMSRGWVGSLRALMGAKKALRLFAIWSRWSEVQYYHRTTFWQILSISFVLTRFSTFLPPECLGLLPKHLIHSFTILLHRNLWMSCYASVELVLGPPFDKMSRSVTARQVRQIRSPTTKIEPINDARFDASQFEPVCQMSCRVMLLIKAFFGKNSRFCAFSEVCASF